MVVESTSRLARASVSSTRDDNPSYSGNLSHNRDPRPEHPALCYNDHMAITVRDINDYVRDWIRGEAAVFISDLFFPFGFPYSSYDIVDLLTIADDACGNTPHNKFKPKTKKWVKIDDLGLTKCQKEFVASQINAKIDVWQI